MKAASVEAGKRERGRPAKRVERVRVEIRGTCADVFKARDRQILYSGPAGVAKTRAILEKFHLCASKYAGARGLFLRKTQTSLTASALVTFQNKVLHPYDDVHFFGGSGAKPAAFQYPNGSEIVVGGMDKSDKVLSTDYDFGFINEGNELTEAELETVDSRMRNGVMPYQQLILDCNPQAPKHWLKQRASSGRMRWLQGVYEDNPRYWDCRCRPALSACQATGSGCDWTPEGREYIGRLDQLTGLRYLRLRKGIWAAAEGLVYDGWDPAVHLINWFMPPREWPRYWSIDFGFTAPFVCQFWAEDGDGRLYLYREIYKTQRLVEDHARQILEVTGWNYDHGALVPHSAASDPLPRAVICDHDAEGRATLERHLGLMTVPAYKARNDGIDALKVRLRKVGDGKPRIYVMRDALVEVDPVLVEAKKPTCFQDEIESYVWDPKATARGTDEPIEDGDHAMDSARYAVAFCDSLAVDAFEMDGTLEWDERVEISLV